MRVAGTDDPDWFDLSGRRHLALFEEALSRAGKQLSDFRDVYDFGCGPGRIMRHLAVAAPDARLYGSDLEAPAVEWLAAQLPEADVRVNGGEPPLPFADDSFDLVLCWSVFSHLTQGYENAWLAELSRVARPGATLLLTVHGEANWRWHVARTPMGDAPELGRLEAELSGDGFAEWEGGVAAGFPAFYRTSFHRPDYVRREWARWFRVLDVVEAAPGDDPDQDVVVLEAPGRAGAALRRVRRAPGGLRRRLRGRRGERTVSIVVPVKDPGPGIAELLDAFGGQRWSGHVEVVAVDSGSTDGTPGLLREKGAKVVEVAAEEFDHGGARNLGAEHATGDALVFVTQTMRPADERWLGSLLGALEREPRLAGVTSRIAPLPGADPLTRRDVERDIPFSGERTVGSEHFTTVSGAVRPEVLREIPFPEVKTIGEDLLWAKRVLAAGHLLGHEPSSLALHSHAYSFADLLGRDFDDGVVRQDAEGRRLEGDAILSDIAALVEADAAYLRDECGLEGDELERWTREAASRRTAQLVGQWLGTNHDRLPPEALDALSLMRRSRRGPSGP